MWLDESGELRLVDMDDGQRLLAPGLIATLRSAGAPKLAELQKAVSSWMTEVWDANDEFVADDDEGRFARLDPPAQFHLKRPESSADLAASLIDQLRASPVRWRTDLSMALMLFLEVDLPAERGEFDE